MEKRLLDVNPDLDLRALPVFLECDGISWPRAWYMMSGTH